MRILTNLFSLCLISMVITACSTSSLNFTTENMMKVHQGMNSNEILAMFGEPKNINVNVCGMPPKQWNCTTWEYDVFPDGNASFTFSGSHNSLVLNDFNIDRN